MVPLLSYKTCHFDTFEQTTMFWKKMTSPAPGRPKDDDKYSSPPEDDGEHVDPRNVSLEEDELLHDPPLSPIQDVPSDSSLVESPKEEENPRKKPRMEIDPANNIKSDRTQPPPNNPLLQLTHLQLEGKLEKIKKEYEMVTDQWKNEKQNGNEKALNRLNDKLANYKNKYQPYQDEYRRRKLSAVSQTFMRFFPLPLFGPETGAISCFDDYFEAAAYYETGIEDDLKDRMIRRRDRASKHFLIPLTNQQQYYGHRPCQFLFKPQVLGNGATSCLFVPHVPKSKDLDCQRAFLCTSTQFDENLTYLGAFEYACDIMLYITGEVNKRWQSLGCLGLDQQFGFRAVSERYFTGFIVLIIHVMKFGPDVKFRKLDCALKDLNTKDDVYWQYFAIPFLRFTKRLLGSRLLLHELWHVETPYLFDNRIKTHLPKGIVSQSVLQQRLDDFKPSSNKQRKIVFPKRMTNLMFFPFIRALQMLSNKYYNKKFRPSGGGQNEKGKNVMHAAMSEASYFQITPQEKKELEEALPIVYDHPELGRRELAPLPNVVDEANETECYKAKDESPLVFSSGSDDATLLKKDDGVFEEPDDDYEYSDED